MSSTRKYVLLFVVYSYRECNYVWRTFQFIKLVWDLSQGFKDVGSKPRISFFWSQLLGRNLTYLISRTFYPRFKKSKTSSWFPSVCLKLWKVYLSFYRMPINKILIIKTNEASDSSTFLILCERKIQCLEPTTTKSIGWEKMAMATVNTK